MTDHKRTAAELSVPDGKRASVLCFVHATPALAVTAISIRVAAHFDAHVCPAAICVKCDKPYTAGDALVRSESGEVCHARCCATSARGRVWCLCHRLFQSPCTLVEVREWPHFHKNSVCSGQCCAVCLGEFTKGAKVRFDANKELVHTTCTGQCVFCKCAVAVSASEKLSVCAACRVLCANCNTDITPVQERMPTYSKTLLCAKCHAEDEEDEVEWIECGAKCRSKNHAYAWTRITDDDRSEERAVVCNKAECTTCGGSLHDCRPIWGGDRKGIILIDDRGFCGNGNCARMCSMCDKYISGKYIEDDKPFPVCDDCPSHCVECEESFEGDPSAVVMAGERPLCATCAEDSSDSD